MTLASLLLASTVFSTTAAADARFVTAPGGAAVVAGPGTIYQTVNRLPAGARVDVREVYQGYALIFMPSMGVEAWVKAGALGSAPSRPAAPAAPKVKTVEPYASVVWTKSGPLNMRGGPGFNHDVLGQCQRGDWVEVVALAGVWAQVQLQNGEEGWVHSDYLTR